jgi:hypothetical protein
VTLRHGQALFIVKKSKQRGVAIDVSLLAYESAENGKRVGVCLGLAPGKVALLALLDVGADALFGILALEAELL